MTDKNSDDTKRIDEEPDTTPAVPAGNRMSPYLKGLLLVVVPIMAAGTVYRAGWLDPAIGRLKSPEADEKPVTALTGLPVKDLVSSSDLLTAVGNSPVDPSSVLFPSFDKPAADEPSDAAKACPPDALEAKSQENQPASGTTVTADSRDPSEKESEPSPEDVGEKPEIVTRKPSEADPGEKEEERTVLPAAAADEAHRAESGTGSDEEPDRSSAKNPRKTDKGKDRHAEASVNNPPPIPRKTGGKTKGGEQSKTDGSDAAALQKPDLEASEAANAERFQLPGALQVRIEGYEGSLPQWGIMVILDDSAFMAKNAKPWSPNPSRAAVTLVGKLPGIMPPGSKIAVRDFLCGKSTDKGRGRPCLSHMLYDWSGSPFKELKPSLERVDPQGSNNPCAAAAYVVKRDFSGIGRLSPRVLVVTNGSAKCAGGKLLKAIDGHGGNGKVVLDVIALRMLNKAARSYVKPVKKTGGAFLKVSGPDELDGTLARYKKVLHKRTVEQVEVRGEKSVYTVNPGEDITLAPGSYSIVLPLVAKLKPSKRTIPNVTIKSGETKILKVRIKQGKPQVRFAKK
ncbi:MAG: hypothetical protein V1792_03755 [Pseudomonadota bacterium]